METCEHRLPLSPPAFYYMNTASNPQQSWNLSLQAGVDGPHGRRWRTPNEDAFWSYEKLFQKLKFQDNQFRYLQQKYTPDFHSRANGSESQPASKTKIFIF